MPRFKQIPEILKLMKQKELIRNVAIVAHIDHGKTTLMDSLLVEAGLLPPQIAGTARALDYLEEEQKRGITIKTANISLLHETNGQAYVVNLVDTPGHVDFTGKVTRALRAVDGAIVVADAVEEIMAQTETVTRQALEEGVRPVLFINKVDRLFTELKLSGKEIQSKLAQIIGNFNNLVEMYAEPEFKNEWKVASSKGSVAFGSALHRWGFTLDMAEKKGIKFTDIIKVYRKNEHDILAKQLPLYQAILDMVVKKCPSPKEAQKYRIQTIWKGKSDSKIGNAMINCNDEDPTIVYITNVQGDSKDSLIATGRVFCGSVKAKEEIYLVEANQECEVEQVSIYMGAFREVVEEIVAGNIAAFRICNLVRAGETIVDISHKNDALPFEEMRYVSEPVVTVAVEPKNPRELPQLADVLNRLAFEDPNLTVSVDRRTGEYLLSGMGELHLETAMSFLQKYAKGMKVLTSPPSVSYRESVSEGGRVVVAKSANKENTFWMQVEPLEEKQLESVVRAYGENVWRIDEHQNVLLNLEQNEQLEEVRGAIIRGFGWACETGPLCEEALRNIVAKLVHVEISKNPSAREPDQITRAVGRAIFGSFLTAKPVLLEPIYRIEVYTPTEFLGECADILSRRRGKITGSVQKNSFTILSGLIPVEETFGLSVEMRSATSGRAFWQCTFSHWKVMPENLAAAIIREIRNRRGLPSEVLKPKKFVDEA
jgi:elongation factor 2